MPPTLLASSRVLLGGDIAHQIGRVLRMQPGDEVCLLDGTGVEYRTRLLSIGRDEVLGEVVERAAAASEAAHRITLYLSLLNKADKFEWALQKCTELGAHAFVPVRSERSVPDLPGPSKLERWARIIREAAEQSGRASLPRLDEAVPLGELLRGTGGEGLRLMPALGARRSLRSALAGLSNGQERAGIGIFIGPEGGFSGDEVRNAQEAGVVAVTLGPRTLRAETAAVTALALTLYALGDME